MSKLKNHSTYSRDKMITRKGGLAMTCFLLLDKDCLQLADGLVPCLWQGNQGKDRPDEEGGAVQQEDPLHPHQLGQVRKCLQRVA